MLVALARSGDRAFVSDKGRDLFATREDGVWRFGSPAIEDLAKNFNKVEGKEAESLAQEAMASGSVMPTRNK